MWVVVDRHESEGPGASRERASVLDDSKGDGSWQQTNGRLGVVALARTCSIVFEVEDDIEQPAGRLEVRVF
jgi:hypothetical protein